jgi:L-type amino acid transporter 9
VLPIIAVLISIYLVIGPIINHPQMEFLYAFLFLVTGLIFYVPFVYFKVRIPGVGEFEFIQNFILSIWQVVIIDCHALVDEVTGSPVLGCL